MGFQKRNFELWNQLNHLKIWLINRHGWIEWCVSVRMWKRYFPSFQCDTSNSKYFQNQTKITTHKDIHQTVCSMENIAIGKVNDILKKIKNYFHLLICCYVQWKAASSQRPVLNGYIYIWCAAAGRKWLTYYFLMIRNIFSGKANRKLEKYILDGYYRQNAQGLHCTTKMEFRNDT